MRSFRRFRYNIPALLTLFLLSALPLLAEDSAPNAADSSAGVLFRWLNFAIIFGGVGFLIAKKGGSFFRSNAKAIAASITQATAIKAEAEQALNIAQNKVARLDQEVSEIRETAKKNWAAESQRLSASRDAEVEKIRQAARAEFSACERVAQQQLREAAASLAVERAGAVVKSKMNADARSRLFQKFLDELGRSAN